jgi:hypothetical protein
MMEGTSALSGEAISALQHRQKPSNLAFRSSISPVKLASERTEFALRMGESMTTLLVAIWMWGLTSLVIVLALGASRDIGYRLGRYYSSVERAAWVSLVACFVAQFIILGLIS